MMHFEVLSDIYESDLIGVSKISISTDNCLHKTIENQWNRSNKSANDGEILYVIFISKDNQIKFLLDPDWQTLF